MSIENHYIIKKFFFAFYGKIIKKGFVLALKKEVKLREHQKNAVEKVLKRDGDLILYHDVGTGKTLSAIAAMEALKKKNKAKKALVVVPASLKDNFAQDGVKKFTDGSYLMLGNKNEVSSGDPHVKSVNKVTPKTSKDYNIVSYDMFKRSPESYIKQTGADTVIYDEIHKGKNDTSKIAKTMKEVRGLHRNFIGLTGSLTSNSPADMVPIVDAMTNGKHILGSKDSFEKRFMVEDRNGKKTIRNGRTLRMIASPYVDFVDRDEMPNHKPPARKVIEHDTVMGPLQSDVYRRVLDKLDTKTKAKLALGVGKISDTEMKAIGNKLMGARQASNSISSVANGISLDDALENSSKAKALIANVASHLKDTKDGQVIIGTQFINGGVDVLKHGLDKEKIPYSVFIGKGNKGVNDKSRKQAIKDYNSGKSRAIIISSAGGEGLNLPNTTAVHMLDGHFNPEVTNQMEARGLRSGGLSHRAEKDRVVELHRYTSKPEIRTTDVISSVGSAINPFTYIGRALENKKIFSKPDVREFSADKWIMDVAKNKDKNNKDIKEMFKTATTHLGHESDIVREYQDKYGDKARDKLGTKEWIDHAGEKKIVDKLRKLYSDTSKSKNYYVNGGKYGATNFEDSDLDENGNVKLLPFLNPRKNPTIGASAVATGLGLASLRAIHKGPPAKQTMLGATLRNGLLPSAISSLSVGGVSALHANNLRTGEIGDMTKPEARRRARLSDIDMLRMLRGENVSKEKIKVNNYAI